jgi:hydroxymethylbilane synthase
MTITGLVAELDGGRIIKEKIEGPCDQSASLGLKLAEALLSRGAATVLERLQHGT